jgi:hypothetical protein
MAKIYSAPKEVKVPTFDWKNIDQYNKDCEQFYVDLKAFIVANGNKGKNVGKVVRYQVADGYAEYMVVSMKPLSLVHIPLGDAYEFGFMHLMTADEIEKNLHQQEVMANLFKK